MSTALGLELGSLRSSPEKVFNKETIDMGFLECNGHCRQATTFMQRPVGTQNLHQWINYRLTDSKQIMQPRSYTPQLIALVICPSHR